MRRSLPLLPAVLLLVVVAVPAHGQDAGTNPPSDDDATLRLVPIPQPELEAYEPAVADQLREVQGALAEVLNQMQGDGASPAELAAAFGDLGRHYHAYELLEAATACYRNAALLQPDDFRWHHLLGRALQDDGDLEGAAAAYERALELAPDDVPAVLYLADIRSLEGDADGAVELYRRAVALDPKASAALAGLGQAALDAGQPARAVELLQGAVDANPTATRLHYPLGLAYRALGDEERARQHLEAAGDVGLKPDDPLVGELDALRSGEKAHLLRGHMAFRAGHYGAAADAYHRAVEAAPESATAQVDLATALGRLGYLEGAEDHLRAALDLDPQSANAHFNLGSILLQKGEIAGAGVHLRRAAELDPDDADAHLALGRVLEAQGHPGEAVVEYRRATALGVRSDGAALGEARLLLNAGRVTEAQEVLEAAHEAIPASVPVISTLARLLAVNPDLDKRDGERAAALAERAYSAEATIDRARSVALGLAEAGRCDEAAEWQHKILDYVDEQGLSHDGMNLEQDLALFEAGPPCRPNMPQTGTVGATTDARDSKE